MDSITTIRLQPADRSAAPMDIPRLGIAYSSTDFDRYVNKERDYHPRPFDKAGDDCAAMRLLKVVLLSDNDNPSTPIQCYFLNQSRFASKVFWERVRYTALSYTWDLATDKSNTEDILIHDEPVCVRRNLWDFLHTMREAHREGPY